MKISVLILLLLAAVSPLCGEPIRLWEGKAPLAKGDAPHDIPAIEAFLPGFGGNMRTAMVIFPGGAYHTLADGHEGRDYAKFFNQYGIAAFVVHYRLGQDKLGAYRHPAMLMDGQRAVRYVRSNAEKFGIDPNRIGVIGSSAGGHLAATVLTGFDHGDAASSDPVERVSSRPDFGVLCYPVISMLEPLAHKGSKKCLLGENPGEDLCRELSAELRVKADTPPCFIWHTVEDKLVPVENSIVFAEALAKHKIPHELHLFSFGSHGLGLNSKSFIRSNAGSWDDMLICWLLQNGFYEIKAGE